MSTSATTVTLSAIPVWCDVGTLIDDIHGKSIESSIERRNVDGLHSYDASSNRVRPWNCPNVDSSSSSYRQPTF